MARKTALEQIGVDLPDEELPPEEDVEQPAAEAETAPEAPEADRPEWLPENYKTVEAFVESKKSLENELRLRGEREREYEQRIQQLEQYIQQPPQAPQQDPGDFRAQIDEAYENDPVGTTLWLVQQANQQSMSGFHAQQQQMSAPQIEAQNELLAAQADYGMAQRYDDWSDMKPKVADVIRNDPSLLHEDELGSLNDIQKALGRAYEVAKYRDLMASQQELREVGVGQAEVARAQKLQAQTLTGATGRPEPLSDADRQLAEMRAARSSSWAHIRANQ